MYGLILVISALLSFILLFYAFSKKCTCCEPKQKKIGQEVPTTFVD